MTLARPRTRTAVEADFAGASKEATVRRAWGAHGAAKLTLEEAAGVEGSAMASVIATAEAARAEEEAAGAEEEAPGEAGVGTGVGFGAGGDPDGLAWEAPLSLFLLASGTAAFSAAAFSAAAASASAFAAAAFSASFCFLLCPIVVWGRIEKKNRTQKIRPLVKNIL